MRTVLSRAPWKRTTERREPLLWRTARSYGDLAELTARWLTGDVAEHPCYYGPPAEETAQLVGLLAAVNRAGFLTESSQPGLVDEESWWTQRAYVSGYCTNETLERLLPAFIASDLVMLYEHAEDHRDGLLPVSRYNDADPVTFVGGLPSLRVWKQMAPAAPRILRGAWFVSLVDPVWERNDRLWPTFTSALGIRPDNIASAGE